MSAGNVDYDVAIIGGGIVGLATAAALETRASASVVVLEAEPRVAAHQTGHNSGVIHSGIYYKPGSLKARLCHEGRAALYAFCREHGVPHDQCGKIIVATDASELKRLDKLRRRGFENGLTRLTSLSPEEAVEYEPHVRCVGALHVGETGVVDFAAVCEALRSLLTDRAVDVRTSHRVTRAEPIAYALRLVTNSGPIVVRQVINCAGLESDRVARMCGIDPGLRIVPFRGEYHDVVPAAGYLVRHLIYPVPDPQFPFLGVHFTRGVDGRVEVGPNAVLALSREGYRWRDISPSDLFECLTYPGFRSLLRRHWRMGAGEVYRSLNRAALVRALQRLVPGIAASDLRPGGAGVRAQAVEPDGGLVDDFRIVTARRSLHVLNAPSPAATASFAIGRYIAEEALRAFELDTRV